MDTVILNFFLASSDLFHLLITFANSLDPDLVRQDLDPNRFNLFDMLIIFHKVYFEKSQLMKKHEILSRMQRFKTLYQPSVILLPSHSASFAQNFSL